MPSAYVVLAQTAGRQAVSSSTPSSIDVAAQMLKRQNLSPPAGPPASIELRTFSFGIAPCRL
jgi:hypothetical protein